MDAWNAGGRRGYNRRIGGVPGVVYVCMYVENVGGGILTQTTGAGCARFADKNNMSNLQRAHMLWYFMTTNSTV